MSAARCRKADAAFAVAKICRAVHLSVRSESGKKSVTHRQHSNPCGAALELCRSAAHAGLVGWLKHCNLSQASCVGLCRTLSEIRRQERTSGAAHLRGALSR